MAAQTILRGHLFFENIFLDFDNLVQAGHSHRSSNRPVNQFAVDHCRDVRGVKETVVVAIAPDLVEPMGMVVGDALEILVGARIIGDHVRQLDIDQPIAKVIDRRLDLVGVRAVAKAATSFLESGMGDFVINAAEDGDSFDGAVKTFAHALRLFVEGIEFEFSFGVGEKSFAVDFGHVGLQF